ncbi:MFS transporter [Saccharopolyspora sp. 5N102]|uniref:MFS transporter n=1 Tax=Saccharopolyspora sp. 5N102 TaxID=3375155 RepID=UPI0037B5A8D5
MKGCFVLAAGSLADLVGRRRTFAIGTGLYAVGALVSALAGDILVLDIARTASGLGAAAALPSGSALLAQAFEGPARARAFGVFGTTTGIGLALGPTIAGVLVGNFSWRAVFLVPAVIAFVVVALTPLIPESRNPAAGRVDKGGTVTFTGALLLLIFGLVEGPQAGWLSALVLGSFLTAAVLLIAFVVIERRQEQPMFDLSVHTVLWILFAMFAVAVPVVALLLRDRRRPAMESSVGDPSMPQPNRTQKPSRLQ